MRNKIAYLITLVFIFFAFQSLQAQSYHKGKKYYKKEYYKKKSKQSKAYAKYLKKEQKALKKYHKERQKAYKKMVKNQRKARRSHPSWYGHGRYKNNHGYVYFPAYKTYYDPHNRRYVYKNRNKWVRSSSLPTVLTNVDLGRVQVQFLSRLPI